MNTLTTERDLGRVEGKLDMALTALIRLEKKWDERSDHVDKRLNALETRFKVSVALGVGSIAANLGDAKHIALGLLHTIF
jgi:hypothetical protein